MSGWFCPKCMRSDNTPKLPRCDDDACPLGANKQSFFHMMPKPDACSHDFQGWREFEDGRGGERVCTKCGMGAMTYSLRTGF
jgi:hypothetical protein